MREDQRHQHQTEIAARILAIAEEAYKKAPKLILDQNQPDPPPLSWHVAFTAAQLVETMIRLMTIRKMEMNLAIDNRPENFDLIREKCEGEVGRFLQILGINLAQEI